VNSRNEEELPWTIPHSINPNLLHRRCCNDVDLIPKQWDQLVRVAASLKNRVCPAHVVVQRLANSSPSDRLAKALTMLGRVVKTIYILKYFNEEDLRNRVPTAVESR
jgi:TnpA family transposase